MANERGPFPLGRRRPVHARNEPRECMRASNSASMSSLLYVASAIARRRLACASTNVTSGASSTSASHGHAELVSTTTANGRYGASTAVRRADSLTLTRVGPSTRSPILSTTTTFTYLECASIPATNTLASWLEAH
jgi:hypothetical protein